MLENLPVLLLKKIIVLPYQELKIEIETDISKNIIDLSEKYYLNKVLIVYPTDQLESNYDADDLPTIGVIGKIKSKIVLPDGKYRITLVGLNRVKVNRYKTHHTSELIFEALVKRIYIGNNEDLNDVARIRLLKDTINKYIDTNPEASNSVKTSINNINDLDMLTDIITNYMHFNHEKLIDYINEFDSYIRANNLIKDINLELEIINIERSIDEKIHMSLEKDQKDYLLRQKIKLLNEELGEVDTKQSEIELYRNRINDLEVSKKIKNRLINELTKYSYTSDNNPDLSVIRNYLDTILSLPWNTFTKDVTDLNKIKKVLDKTHFGLEEVKSRILEYIAIKKNTNSLNAPIICLVGPPGTGKTSLGISISNALNREFYKISVGGLNDPSLLTGHKRTYLGSSPGKIIQGLTKCGTKNPVILIDEVDKIVTDFKGDPSAVLLDILDNQQNKEFIDNYIEEPFDLSEILFILTANDINGISPALKDRLEIININSYTEVEKLDIAKKYLIPKIVLEYNTDKINMKNELILSIIASYTKEAGVRELDRILRKIYRYYIINNMNIKTIKASDIVNVLGPIKYNIVNNINHVGSVNLLGVTPYGGAIIPLEAIFIEGNNQLVLTGNIDESTKESAYIALNYLMSNKDIFKIKKDLTNQEIHINALNYSIKKNGTSGGVGFAVSILSLLLDKKIEDDICFTGEITLHGNINQVGGIKEKLIGAYNNNKRIVYIPSSNIPDLNTVPDYILSTLKIITVDNFLDIYNSLFKN